MKSVLYLMNGELKKDDLQRIKELEETTTLAESPETI
jgi:hypothetical protein